MSQNIVEIIVKPEMPDVTANQGILVYIPIVTSNTPGAAKFDDEQFNVAGGEVSIKSSYLHDAVEAQIGDVVDDRIEAYVADVCPASISRTINSMSFTVGGINVVATDTVTQVNGDTRTYTISERMPLRAGRGVKFDIIAYDKTVQITAVGLEKNNYSEVFNDYVNNVISTNAQYAHVEGYANELHTDNTYAPHGLAVHVEGYQNYVIGDDATHVEGCHNLLGYEVVPITGDPGVYMSHIEGQYNSGRDIHVSHIEGEYQSVMHVQYAHVEGRSHSIQNVSVAVHVEGYANNLPSSYSEGLHLSGKNSNATMPSGFGAAIEVIGNGTNGSTRSNARVMDVSGNVWIAGKFVQEGTPVNNKDLTTKLYVDGKLADMKDYVDTEVSTIPKMALHIVQTLPTTDIDTEAIYLVPSNGETGNIYTEYMYVNNAWELLGSANVVIPKLVSCSVVTSSVALDNNTHKYTVTKTVSETYDDASTNSVSETEVLPFVLSTGLTGTIDNGAIVVTAVGAKDTSGGEIFNDYTNNQAGYNYAHVEGQNNLAGRMHQHVFGYYNELDTSAIEVVGAGTSVTRKNIRTLDTAGNMWVAGKITQEGTPVDNDDVTTKQYVDSATSGVQTTAIGYADYVKEYAKNLAYNNQREISDIWKTMGTLGAGLGQVVITKSASDDYEIPTSVTVDGVVKPIIEDARMMVARVCPMASGEVAINHLQSITGHTLYFNNNTDDITLRCVKPANVPGQLGSSFDYLQVDYDGDYVVNLIRQINVKDAVDVQWSVANFSSIIDWQSIIGNDYIIYTVIQGSKIRAWNSNKLYVSDDAGFSFRTVTYTYSGLKPVGNDYSANYFYGASALYKYDEINHTIVVESNSAPFTNITTAVRDGDKIYAIGLNSSTPIFYVYDISTSTWSQMSLPQTWSTVDEFETLVASYGTLYLVALVNDNPQLAVYDVNVANYIVETPIPFVPDFIVQNPGQDDVICFMEKTSHTFILIDETMNVYGPFVLDDIPNVPQISNSFISDMRYSANGLIISTTGSQGDSSYCLQIPIDPQNLPSDESDLTCVYVTLPSGEGVANFIYPEDSYRDYIAICMTYKIYGWMPDSNGRLGKLTELTHLEQYYNEYANQEYTFAKVITLHNNAPENAGDILYTGAYDVTRYNHSQIDAVSLETTEINTSFTVNDVNDNVVTTPFAVVFNVPYGENQGV